MSNWGISDNASEKEKIKSRYSDELHGLNSCGRIDYKTYNDLWDFGMKLLDKMYELGMKERKNSDSE